jgi:aminobenzoyl-glutamate utilization protein B
MERVGPSKFSETHKEFAEEITKSFEPGYKEGFVKRESLPPEFADILLHEEILERPKEDPEPRGSTDVGDVSWCCPTAQFTTVCNAIGTPGHSWQYVAQAGMGIGHTGAIRAAKILAEAGLELMTCPDLLEKAKAEFRERTGGTVYKCAMPEDFKPPFHQIANK